jgi:DNA topoisomerase-1
LRKSFSSVIDYDFTATLESELDKIATGEKKWKDVVKTFYDTFHPIVDKLSIEYETKPKESKKILLDTVGETNYYKLLTKNGPVVLVEKGETKRYVNVDVDKVDIDSLKAVDIEGIRTYPFVIGKHTDENINLCKGPYGFYLKHGGKNHTIKDIEEPENITLEECIKLIDGGGGSTGCKLVKEYGIGIKVFIGQYGPFIKTKTKNIPIPKTYDAEKITKDECQKIIKDKGGKESKYSGTKNTDKYDKTKRKTNIKAKVKKIE